MATTADSLMVLIPAGEFIMGKGTEQGNDFSPAHKVRVDSFLMDRHEVTNGEYLAFCNETGYKFPEFWNTNIFKSGEGFLNYPVVGINWMDAMRYAKWAGKRLPTEAEWEYAARGGLTDNEYPNGNTWTKEKAKQEPDGWKNLICPVEQDQPNGYGLYDMGGNVWEWISDIYSETYYQNSESYNPAGPKTGTNRVIRSGSWHSGAMCKKVYFRKGLPANWCDFAVGLRCVKDVD
ncbi:MAG: SUMF1/EgtB/PvdO family nonheme iron enzyme [Bacteroidales bacterium]|nr:SUMF1/EgtB/PvdO family nonheme iron enzyme [Bacteroidales bacterium]